MSKAELARVLFQSARVTGVDFSFSNLSRARLDGLDLQGANLTGSYLYLTQLGGANLSGVTGLTQAQVDIACGTAQTKLPAGLAPPKGWPCKEEED
jgi:uncharacterized protein YjbI with pentapeptide repeats